MKMKNISEWLQQKKKKLEINKISSQFKTLGEEEQSKSKTVDRSK
jgi:hypothetical protein